MNPKVTIIIGIATVGGLLMFGILHYRGVVGRQQAQVQCTQGDQKADIKASEAQHAADLRSLAELQEQLRIAQQKGDQAQAAAKHATARAAELTSRIDTLEKTDKTVGGWSRGRIPAALRQ